MGYFILHIDGRTQYVRSTNERLRKRMFAHIRARRAEGLSLAQIEFCWTPIRFSSI